MRCATLRVDSSGDGSRRKLLQRVTWVATALLLLGALGFPGFADEIVKGAMSDKPGYVTQLQTAYGGPSEGGFGSAVFRQPAPGGDVSRFRAAMQELEGLRRQGASRQP